MTNIRTRPREALLDPGDGDELLPFEIHTLFCIGKNYSEHAREMGAEPDRSEPSIFLKPVVSLRTGREVEIELPAWSSLVHHEVELVVLIGRTFDPKKPMACVVAYGVGLDLTLRDLQSKAKAAGAPWTASKGFPGAAPVSLLYPADDLDPAALQLRLEVDGQLRQSGSTGEMLHGLPEILGHLDERYGLLGGELIFTGTPAGVGPVRPGDRLVGTLSTAGGKQLARLEVLARPPSSEKGKANP